MKIEIISHPSGEQLPMLVDGNGLPIPSDMLKRAVLMCLLMFLAGQASRANESAVNSTQSDPWTARLKDLREAETSVKVLSEKRDRNDKGKEDIYAGYLNALGQSRSFIGDAFGAMDAFGESNRIYERTSVEKYKAHPDIDPYHVRPGELTFEEIIRTSSAENAIAAIVRAAQKRQIVMLNEAHHVPMHRAFAMQLARELRKIGFEYMACEAFTNDGSQPLKKGYVDENSGYYTNDTAYGNLLRDAIRSKWKFVSYEPQDKPREFMMAKNIFDRILKDNPKAKIFIYVGYGHIAKLPVATEPGDKSMLAAQLKKLSGIDPLTIDQTSMYQQYVDKNESRIYENALSKNFEDRPYVLVGKNNQFIRLPNEMFTQPEKVDIQVVYPKYKIDPATGRPAWMSSLANLTPRPVPKELIPSKGRRLVYAYGVDDPIDSVPVDVVLLESGRPTPMLMLPTGTFRFETEN